MIESGNLMKSWSINQVPWLQFQDEEDGPHVPHCLHHLSPHLLATAGGSKNQAKLFFQKLTDVWK